MTPGYRSGFGLSIARRRHYKGSVALPSGPGLPTTPPALTALSFYTEVAQMGNPPAVPPSGTSAFNDWCLADLSAHTYQVLDDFTTSPDPLLVYNNNSSGGGSGIIVSDGVVIIDGTPGDVVVEFQKPVSVPMPWRAWIRVQAETHNTFGVVMFGFNNAVTSAVSQGTNVIFGGVLFRDPLAERDGTWVDNTDNSQSAHTALLATDPRVRPVPNDNYDAEIISSTPVSGSPFGLNGPGSIFYQMEKSYLVYQDAIPEPPFWVVLTVTANNVRPEIWTTDPALSL